MFGFKNKAGDFSSSENAPLSEKIKKSFSDCDDFSERKVDLGGGKTTAYVCWLDGCVSGSEVAENILRPLHLLRCGDARDASDEILRGGVYSAQIKERSDPQDAAADLTAGFAAVIFDSLHLALTFEVKTDEHRTVDTPTVEKSVMGAKDAFVEVLRINTSLVRRRLQTPLLKLRETSVGSRAKTKVALLYLEGTAPPERVAAVRERISHINIEAVLSAGDLERALADVPRTSFPQVLHTERPDRFAQAMMQGQVGVLCDGLPMGFLLPGTLPGMMKVTEDAARHRIVSGFLVALRYVALLLSLLLPAVYVAIAMYHQEMIPYKLLLSVIASKQEVPFPTAAEVLGMILSFELLQEAGLRLPESIGQTISIIGALIVGQSAVEAKVLSPIVIIVVAMAGIGGYTQPSQELGAAIRVWRFLLVLCAIALGMYGIMAGLMLLLWRLADMECLSTAFLSPLCDKKGRR